MGLLPRDFAGRIKYFQDRQTTWDTNKTVIGLSADDMTTMSGLITSATDGQTAQADAQRAAKAATVTLHNAQATLVSFGMDLIKKIKAKAGQNPDVYALAEIDPPAPPSPVPAPGMPSDFTAELRPDGSLHLGWKCVNPVGAQGTIYQVYRTIDDEQTYIGGSGTREFIDSTIPAGTSTIEYTIQAVRSTLVGVANNFTVKFGAASGGMATITVGDGPKPAKVAA